MANIGVFEGFAFGVYLRVITERQGRKTSQNCSGAKLIFTPKFMINPLPSKAEVFS